MELKRTRLLPIARELDNKSRSLKYFLKPAADASNSTSRSIELILREIKSLFSTDAHFDVSACFVFRLRYPRDFGEGGKKGRVEEGEKGGSVCMITALINDGDDNT